MKKPLHSQVVSILGLEVASAIDTIGTKEVTVEESKAKELIEALKTEIASLQEELRQVETEKNWLEAELHRSKHLPQEGYD